MIGYKKTWILFCLVHAAWAQEEPITAGPYKVLAADFTGDSTRDLIVSYYPAGVFSVQQGDGKGAFTSLGINVIRLQDRDAKAGDNGEPVFNMAHGDIDRDGLADLVIGLGKFVSVTQNTGHGRFERRIEYQLASDAKGVRLADLDRDGQLDLLYTERGTGRPGDTATGKLFLRQGLGNWQFGSAQKLEAGISAYYIECADLNNDGHPDILVPNELGTTVSYWLNPGEQIFAARQLGERSVLSTSGFRINDVRAADFNGDGYLDLVTANWASSTVSLFFGKGDGSFREEILPEGGKQCVFFAVGDLDGDKDLDFAITHWTEDFVSVFLNGGGGQFSDRIDYPTGLGNYGVTVFDADGDGHLDVLTTNYRARSKSLLIGIGDGTFQPAITNPDGVIHRDGKWVREAG